LAAESGERIDNLVRRLSVSWDMDAQVAASEAYEELLKLGKQTVPACLKVIEGGNASARMWAGAALAQTGDPRAVDPLLKLLADKEERVRRVTTWHIHRFMGKDPRVVVAMGEQMADPSLEVRQQAAKVLNKHKRPPAALPEIRKALKSPLLAVRVDALLLILRYERKQTKKEIPALIDSDADGFIRSAAIGCLTKLGKPDKDTTLLLVRLMGDPGPLVAEAALTVLREAFEEPQFSPQDMKEVVAIIRRGIPAVLDRPEENVRVMAVPLYAHFYREHALKRVEAMLKEDPSPAVRAVAAKSVARLGITSPSIYVPLLECLADPEPEVRQAGLRTLVNLAMSKQTPRQYAMGLKQILAQKSAGILRDKSPDVRALAYSSLGALLKGRMAPVLLKAVQSEPDAAARRGAVTGLFATEVRTEPVLRALIGAIGDPDIDVNTTATGLARSAIKQIDLPDDERARVEATLMADLSALAKHSDPAIRARALPILGAVGKEKALDQLIAAVKQDPDAAARKAALDGLMRTMVIHSRCVEACLDALHDETSGVRKSAFQYVGYVFAKYVSPDLKLKFSAGAQTAPEARKKQTDEIAAAWKANRAKFEANLAAEGAE